MEKSIQWKLSAILLSAGILSVIAVLPYAFTLAAHTVQQAEAPLPLIAAASIIQSSVLFALAVFFGLKLSGKLGLGLPFLEEFLLTKKVPPHVRSMLRTSIFSGIAVGIAIILLDLLFTLLNTGISLWTGEMPPFWMGFLASFYGGIGEEILLRLFLMTFLAWILGKLKKPGNSITEHNLIMWSAIIISTVVFGLGHLPITESVTALTPLVIVRALLLNGIGGVVFGGLYWKKGLESAMVAHFSTDIVLHTLLPLVLLFI